MRTFLITITLISSVACFSQSSADRKVYTAALRYYYKEPVSIVVTDSSVNDEIASFDYTSLIETFKSKKYLFNKEADPSWLIALEKADELKAKLTKKRITINKSDSLFVRLVSKDSIQKSMRVMGHDGFEKQFQVRDRVELSSIIYLGNKAIIELTMDCGSLCGETVLIFLEKRGKTWIGIYRQMLSIS